MNRKMAAMLVAAGILEKDGERERVLPPTEKRPKRTRDPVAELRRRRRERNLAKLRGKGE